MLRFHQDFESSEAVESQTVMKDAFSAIKNESDSGKIGYYKLPTESLSLVDEVMNSDIYHNCRIKDILIAGIGGSSLGIKAINQILLNKEYRKLHFLENSDPMEIMDVIAPLKKESTLIIVISKSGSTVETTSIFKFMINHFSIDLNSEDSKRIITITDPGSSLSKFSDEYNIKQYNIPLNVGGRFSVLSAVGVVPLTLAGLDVKKILNGADEFLQDFFNHKEDHILQKAHYYYVNAEKFPINVLFGYSTKLENFTKWYVQLWGESLGKIDRNGKSVGLTPIGLIGAVDQHSFLQLIIEGVKDKSVTFINVEDFGVDIKVPEISLKHIEKCDYLNGHTFTKMINEQCSATKESLIKSGVSVDSITLDSLSEKHIGRLVIYYELLTSLVGSMLNVNTYDQPGVELGKQILESKFK
jgi:glucose-6-phosphate isomerase